ncbi:MAG TPA: hypothetical protein VM577_10820, partial [Anaerovoracaceae bacterium]|nr:hypothetical protein [Anaerovoracaceae bacterium]
MVTVKLGFSGSAASVLLKATSYGMCSNVRVQKREAYMPKFRKKPVEIEANQWFKNGDHPKDYAEVTTGIENGQIRSFSGEERKDKGWEGGVVRYFRSHTVPGTNGCRYCDHSMHVHG